MSSTDPSTFRSAPREFFAGVGTLFRGFGMWGRRPDLMLLGLLPAAIVAAAIVTVLVLYLLNATEIAGFLTPFADDWEVQWRDLLRLGVAAALLIGIVAASVLGFTAATLVVGDPFYERIWRAVEHEHDPALELADPPFWRTVGDALVLVVRGALIGILIFAVGLIPVVGGVVAAVLGAWTSGLNLASELTARPLESRGLDRASRRRVLRGRRARVAGFGIATYLLFLVPGGAVLGMAPAVVGATDLARTALGTRPFRSFVGESVPSRPSEVAGGRSPDEPADRSTG